MKTLRLAAVAALVAFAASSASAAATLTNRACSVSNLTSVTVTACSGFYVRSSNNNGNLLTGTTGNLVSGDVADALIALGLTPAEAAASIYIEKIPTMNGSLTANFTPLLFGDVIVAHHLGNGAPVFNGSPNYNGNGGGTAFYRFNAGTTGLDTYTLNAAIAGGASSGAALFRNGRRNVPTPGTIALIGLGLTGMAFAHRRRQQKA